MTDIVDSLLQW